MFHNTYLVVVAVILQWVQLQQLAKLFLVRLPLQFFVYMLVSTCKFVVPCCVVLMYYKQIYICNVTQFYRFNYLKQSQKKGKRYGSTMETICLLYHRIACIINCKTKRNHQSVTDNISKNYQPSVSLKIYEMNYILQ